MTDQQVLELVERIAGEDGDEANDNPILALIYRLTHSHVTTHICHEDHESWRSEAERLYREKFETVNP